MSTRATIEYMQDKLQPWGVGWYVGYRPGGSTEVVQVIEDNLGSRRVWLASANATCAVGEGDAQGFTYVARLDLEAIRMEGFDP